MIDFRGSSFRRFPENRPFLGHFEVHFWSVLGRDLGWTSKMDPKWAIFGASQTLAQNEPKMGPKMIHFGPIFGISWGLPSKSWRICWVSWELPGFWPGFGPNPGLAWFRAGQFWLRESSFGSDSEQAGSGPGQNPAGFWPKSWDFQDFGKNPGFFQDFWQNPGVLVRSGQIWSGSGPKPTVLVLRSMVLKILNFKTFKFFKNFNFKFFKI